MLLLLAGMVQLYFRYIVDFMFNKGFALNGVVRLLLMRPLAGLFLQAQLHDEAKEQEEMLVGFMRLL